MAGTTKKATFNIHTDVLTALDEIAAQGIVTSKNALVEQALIKELRELKRQQTKRLWQEASKDPLFMDDINKVEQEFQSADAESTRRTK
jgi:hypothetical protein